MAKATEVTIDIKVNIPDDTVCRCLRILEMWMDDNPDKRIIVDQRETETGFVHKIHIESKVRAK